MSRMFGRGFGLSKKHITFVKKIILPLVVCSMLFCTGISVASTEGGHGESAVKGWVATDWYRVMNFAVLAAALFFLLRKPASQALNARIKGIQDQLSSLEAEKIAAEKKLAEYKKRLTLLDEEANRIVAEYKKQGEAAKVRIIKEAESAAAKLEEQARRTIEHEFKIAKATLQEEIFEKALKKAEELIKNRITSEDQDRLVDEYLSKVGVK